MNGHGNTLPPNGHHFADKSVHPRLDIPSSYHQGGTTFAFRKRWGQLDWRKLASVDVDRIAKEMDFHTLQQNIMNITFCNIETEEFHRVDPNFIKVFRLSQLIIEYLLHSQQYLSSHSASLQQNLLQVNQELDKAINNVKSRDEEIKAIKKENRKRRKVIEAYQDMINAGATGLHTCPVCKREFVSGEYLHSHIHRRHPNHLPKNELDNEPKTKPQLMLQEELEARLMEQMTDRLLISEKQIREEMKQTEQETINFHVKEFEEWKEEEKKRMAIEMEEFKKPIIAELEMLHQEKEILTKTLQEKEVELLQAQSRRQSHLGHLDGAKEMILDGTNQSKVEIKNLTESLEAQIQEMQAKLKKQERLWQKRMQNLSTSYQEQLAESVAKLEALEHGVLEGSLHDSKDKNISRKLKSLQQKMKQQEELLQSQQDQLTTLQSREPSPIHASPLKDYLSDSGTSGEDSDDNEQPDFLVDGKFTPFQHQPMIKTKYPHSQEHIEKIRRQTQAIFSDTLVQKGVSRDVDGLKNSDFEQKMTLLDHERQQKIRSHFNFAEHRQRLGHVLDEATTDYHQRASTQRLQVPLKSGATAKGMGKPPKPAPKMTSPKTGTKKASIESSEVLNEPVEHGLNSESVASSCSEDTVDSSGNNPLVLAPNSSTQPHVAEDVSVHVVVTDTTAPPQGTSGKAVPALKIEDNSKEVDSPWDSDDSFEELVASQGGRISSTPVKARSTGTAVAVGRPLPVDNESLDSFDLSSSDPVAASQPSKVNSLVTIDKGVAKQTTVTSQSALTSVSVAVTSQSGLTSVSFDSDLDISDLT